jgi:hypothetical protein
MNKTDIAALLPMDDAGSAAKISLTCATVFPILPFAKGVSVSTFK